MTVQTNAGSKLYIGTTSANAATDTYVEVGEIVSFGDFGRVYNEIKFDTVNTRGTRKFKGTFDDGSMAMSLGRDPSDVGQAAIIAARDSDDDYNFKVSLNDAPATETATVTITIAAPGVVSWTAHGLTVGEAVKFTTTGALPTGLTAGTTYYVKTATDADSFTVAATAGGSEITTTGTQSGVHTGTDIPSDTSFTFQAKVMSYTVKIGGVNTVVGADCMLSIQSGSIVEVAAAA